MAITFAECGVDRSTVEKVALAALRRVEDGNYRYSPYVLSQCFEALEVAQIEDQGDQISERLLEYLESTALDSANFLNITTSLNAIALVRNKIIDSKVRLSVASLFGETCFRDNGSWYRSPVFSAWAIISLTRFSHEIVIKAPKSEIIFETNKLLDEIADDYKLFVSKIRRRLSYLLVSVLVLGFLLSFFVFYSSIYPDSPEWQFGALGGLTSVIGGWVVRQLIYYYKNHSLE